MAESSSPTDGMVDTGDGWLGSVGISLAEQEIKQGDYTSYDSSNDELKQLAISLQKNTATDILSAFNISNKTNALSIEANLKSAELIQNSMMTLAKVMTNMARSLQASTIETNRINEVSTRETQRISEASQILQSEQYIVSSNIRDTLKELNETLKNKSFNLSTGSVNLDTTEIKKVLEDRNNNQKITNDKILEGIESQKKANEKLIQKLDEELKKDITYNGKALSKTELENLKNLENLKGSASDNEFSLNDGLELLEDFLSDGFDINFNPFEIILDELKKEFEIDSNDIKIKYNLKEELK